MNTGSCAPIFGLLVLVGCGGSGVSDTSLAQTAVQVRYTTSNLVSPAWSTGLTDRLSGSWGAPEEATIFSIPRVAGQLSGEAEVGAGAASCYTHLPATYEGKNYDQVNLVYTSGRIRWDIREGGILQLNFQQVKAQVYAVASGTLVKFDAPTVQARTVRLAAGHVDQYFDSAALFVTESSGGCPFVVGQYMLSSMSGVTSRPFRGFPSTDLALGLLPLTSGKVDLIASDGYSPRFMFAIQQMHTHTANSTETVPVLDVANWHGENEVDLMDVFSPNGEFGNGEYSPASGTITYVGDTKRSFRDLKMVRRGHPDDYFILNGSVTLGASRLVELK